MQLLNEIKLSRLMNHFKGDKPVGIITAFRGEVPEKQNVANNRAYAQDLRKKGFGYVWLDGAWIENRGEEDELHVSEVSILVIGNEGDDSKLFAALVAGAKKYNQDAFVFKGADGKIGIYDKGGKSLVSFSGISVDKIADNYSKMRSGNKGRTFVFEDMRNPMGYGLSLRRFAETLATPK